MTEPDLCPCCGQEVRRPDSTLERLRARCAELGIVVTERGEVRSADAARLLGVQASTLRQRRYRGDPTPCQQRGQDVFYALSEIADLLDASTSVYGGGAAAWEA